MNSNQSLWILSSVMTVILCGIGVLLMLDFDSTVRRIVNEEVSIKTLNSEESIPEETNEPPVTAVSKTPSETESPKIEKEPEGMDIKPTPAVLNENADDKPDPPKSNEKSKHQTAAIAPQIARLTSEGSGIQE